MGVYLRPTSRITVLVVAFKLSVGIKLFVRQVNKALRQNERLDVSFVGDFVDDENIGVFHVCGGTSPFQMVCRSISPTNLFKLAFITLRLRPAVVYFAGSHPLNVPFSLFLRTFCKSKLVAHIHDPVPHSGRWYRLIIFLSQFLHAHLSQKVGVFGETLGLQIQKYYRIPGRNLIILKHGIPRDVEAIKLPSIPFGNRRKVSFLGRIEHYKGIETFVDAIQQLSKSNQEVYNSLEFLIAGEGTLEPSVESRFKSLKIDFINRALTDREFQEYLESSLVSVLPYRSATMTGNVQLAYAYGAAVIATRVGGLPDLVRDGETGYLVDPESPLQLSEAIGKIVSWKKDRKLLSRELYFDALKQFQWSDCLRPLIGFCHSVEVAD